MYIIIFIIAYITVASTISDIDFQITNGTDIEKTSNIEKSKTLSIGNIIGIIILIAVMCVYHIFCSVCYEKISKL